MLTYVTLHTHFTSDTLTVHPTSFHGLSCSFREQESRRNKIEVKIYVMLVFNGSFDPTIFIRDAIGRLWLCSRKVHKGIGLREVCKPYYTQACDWLIRFVDIGYFTYSGQNVWLSKDPLWRGLHLSLSPIKIVIGVLLIWLNTLRSNWVSMSN